jgi:transcriptional regulator with XRE-family HTH domain
MSISAEIARLVRQKREEKGFTQVKLAELANVDVKTIRDFELERNPNIGLENLLSICMALDLITIPIRKPITTEEERMILVEEITGQLNSYDIEKLRFYRTLTPELFELIIEKTKDCPLG